MYNINFNIYKIIIEKSFGFYIQEYSIELF